MRPPELVSPIVGSTLQRAAELLLPSDGAGEIRIDGAFVFDQPPTTSVCVVGRTPSTGGRRQALADCVGRERLLHELKQNPPSGYRAVGVHSVPSGDVRIGRRGSYVRWARAGILVELHRGVGVPRVLDEVFARAGGRGAIRVGAGGEIVADLGSRVLRATVSNAPLVSTAALRALAGRLQVPRVLASGTIAAAGGPVEWSVETRLSGRAPRHLGRVLAHDVATFCAGLPRTDDAPTAPFGDLADLASMFPKRSRLWSDIARRLTDFERAPSITRHGDLWTGNLLANHGRLIGVVDWDAWHPAGMPGTDLLNLYAFDPRVAVGRRALERPWRSAGFADLTRSYWRALGIWPTPEFLDAVGAAWWAGLVTAAMRRNPDLRRDERWLHDNIETAAPAFA